MSRLIVLFCACVGAWAILSNLVEKAPSLASNAFSLGFFHVSWAIVGLVGLWVLALKVTK